MFHLPSFIFGMVILTILYFAIRSFKKASFKDDLEKENIKIMDFSIKSDDDPKFAYLFEHFEGREVEMIPASIEWTATCFALVQNNYEIDIVNKDKEVEMSIGKDDEGKSLFKLLETKGQE